MPKAVIFDVDGTLIDTVDLHAACWIEALAHFGFHPTFEDVRSQIGKGGDQLLPVFVPEQVLAARQDEIEDFRGRLFKRAYLPKARALPGVRPLFERIRADGVPTAVATSAHADELDSYLELCGVADLVEVKATSEDAERSKPAPDIFQAALTKLQLDAADAVVVGDSPFDAQAAGRAGIVAVGVRSGGFPDADLTGAGYIEIWNGPEDLLDNYPRSRLSPWSVSGTGSAA